VHGLVGVVTMSLAAWLLWTSQAAHVAFIVAMCAASAWNASSFYFVDLRVHDPTPAPAAAAAAAAAAADTTADATDAADTANAADAAGAIPAAARNSAAARRTEAPAALRRAGVSG